MIPFLILGVLGVGFLALASKANAMSMPTQAQQQARSSGPVPGTLPPGPQQPTLDNFGGGPNTGAMLGLGATAYTGGISAAASSGLLSSTSGLVKSVPIIGAIAGIGLGIYGAISAHHKAALAKEGQSLNAADPLFAARLQSIVAAVNSGQIDRPTALSLLDQSLAEYDANVASITNNPKATADSSNCNAACYIRVHYHLPALALAKQVVQAGGTVNVPPIPAHATQSGLAGYTLSVR